MERTRALTKARDNGDNGGQCGAEEIGSKAGCVRDEDVPFARFRAGCSCGAYNSPLGFTRFACRGWRFRRQFSSEARVEGVEMGVDAELPRTPFVFRPKLIWRLLACERNYASADKFADKLADVIRSNLLDDVPRGRVIGPLTLEQAAEVCQCERGELIVGKVGRLHELPGKFRVADVVGCGPNTGSPGRHPLGS